jgi:hypothetical protein
MQVRCAKADSHCRPPQTDCASDIKLDGRDMPEFHPILTTDFFEFGTHNNNLEDEGCAVEMGDAVLGLVCSELENPPLRPRRTI